MSKKKHIAHRVAEFLQSLNDAAIESVMAEFSIQRADWEFSNLQESSHLCASVFQVVRENPLDPGTASSIGQFWDRLAQMETVITLTNGSTRASQVMIMLSTWTMLDWIATTVERSFENLSPEGTWISKLLQAITLSIQQAHGHRQKFKRTSKNNPAVYTLKAVDYLPYLENAEDFTFTVPRLYLDPDRTKKSIRRLATDAIGHWLSFPLTPSVIAKCSLIGTLLECGSTAILFLDQVWQMFKSPFSIVIHGTPNQRLSSHHTASVLEEFHQQFLNHPVMDSSSNMYKLLSELNNLSVKWGSRSKITLTPRTPSSTGDMQAHTEMVSLNSQTQNIAHNLSS